MLDRGLPARVQAKGVPVEYYPGWDYRSAGSYDPFCALFHHTAGGAGGRAPSLGTVANGRPGLPGPLAQGLQTREPDGWDHFIAIASGRANHAGVGIWRGYAGNIHFAGLEVEHTGVGRVPEARLEVGARIIAAMLEAPGSSWNSAYAAQHFEYATPKGRKIDFRELYPYNTDSFRARVQYWIGRRVDDPQPAPQPPQTANGDDVYFLIHAKGDTKEYLTDLDFKIHMRNPTERNWFLWNIRANGGACVTEKDNSALEWMPEDVAMLRDVRDDDVAGRVDALYKLYDAAGDTSVLHHIVEEAVGKALAAAGLSK